MLNPLLFFLKNKKSAFIISTTLLVSVFCISFITILINSVYATSKEANISPFESFSMLTYVGDNKDNAHKEIEQNEDIDTFFNVVVSYTSINTVFGTTSSYIVFLDNESKLTDVLSRCDLHLQDGTISSLAENEIIMHHNLLKNKKLDIGSNIDNFEIVGTFSGDNKLSFGVISQEKLENHGSGEISYLVFPKDNKLAQLNQSLLNLDESEWATYSYLEATNFLNESFSTINLVLLIIVIMVSVCLSTAVAALVYTVYSNRYDEFAILNAIGYKKSKIKIMLFQEITIITLFSWLLGYGASLIFSVLIDILIYADMGQTMPIATADGVLYTLIVPILVTICAVFPAIRKLSRTDLVSIIERR